MDAVYRAALEQRLVEVCSALHANDPNETRVYDAAFLPGYGGRLGEALRHNTIVLEIRFQQAAFCLSEDGILQEPGSAVHPLLSWIRTSASLQTVVMERQGPFNRYILHAAGSNSNIVELDVPSNISHDPLALLLRATTSIRKLSVHLFETEPAFATSELDVPSALGANRTVEQLNLYAHGNVDLSDVVLELATHPLLSELRLDLSHSAVGPSPQHLAAIAHLLASSPSLQTLILHTYAFLVADDVTMVMTALRANACGVTGLRLINCLMTAEAVERFVSFLQADANQGNNLQRNAGQGNSSIGALRALHLEFDRTTGLDWFVRTPLYTMAATLLTSSSVVQEFSLLSGTRRNVDTAGLLQGLLLNEPEGQLRTLTLDTVNVESFHVLAAFLRRTARLETLCVSLCQRVTWEGNNRSEPIDPVQASLWMPVFRENGSLKVVNVTKRSHFENRPEPLPYWNDEQRRRIWAYSQRNKQVPAMLAKPSLPFSDSPLSSEAESAEEECHADLKSFPSLFCSTMEAPRMAPNALLIGLTAATENNVGYYEGDMPSLDSLKVEDGR